ncbi:SMP-30/gluconolactonase/LRE family protein [Roseococcus pinisoli]|uniref:SMP-30/gluconolactonase/LRE family protein n=1 Tax=Roseococcus pinisoli TaxID=2835040 RepID=A0ABS5QJ00_9PROT|nr:SMP-30/gluconolactonase/LRE family protein [Roseococcus pinisoli]MBS7812885.1 SMP-30/gluconolactonase/LRE family protein [Roseococcus pinisoli]
MYHQTPRVIPTQALDAMPATLRRNIVTDWARGNKFGQPTDCFLEGPCFDAQGRLHVTDIPHGRIFRLDGPGEWALVTEYDGEPNGLALHPDGKRMFIADYKQGILALDLATGAVTPALARRNSERFKGPNDLVFARNGDLYFTDQGQTGLHDPTGRVYRLRPDGGLDCLLANGPSPNGLALSPDEKVLFVAMTRDNAVWRLPLMPDGTTTKVGRFASFYGVAGPDGMAVDGLGNLLVAHASLGCIFVVSPRGEQIACIESCRGAVTTNLAFGGPEGKTVFVTESETGAILTAEWEAAGASIL